MPYALAFWFAGSMVTPVAPRTSPAVMRILVKVLVVTAVPGQFHPLVAGLARLTQ